MKKSLLFSSILASSILLTGCIGGDSPANKYGDDDTGGGGSAAAVGIPTVVIRVTFDDFTSFENDAAWWNNLFFGNGGAMPDWDDPAIMNNKSVNGWFSTQSQGTMGIQPVKESQGTANDGIIDFAFQDVHPDPSKAEIGNDARAVFDAAIPEIDQYIDFSQYDKNGDGELTEDELQVVAVWANGEMATWGEGSAPAMWAHKWNAPNVGAQTFDGVTGIADTTNYFVMGEKHGTSTSPLPATIGIIIHELGHSMFNLPDLYDTDGSSSGIGNWGMMGAGSWCISAAGEQAGSTPCPYSFPTRVLLGIANYTEIDTTGNNGTFTLFPRGTEKENGLILSTESSTEFFMVEASFNHQYDAGLFSLNNADPESGIQIWHFDGSVSTNANDSQRIVDLEEASDKGMDSKSHRGKIENLWTEGEDPFNDSNAVSNSKLNDGTATQVNINSFQLLQDGSWKIVWDN